MVLKFCGTRCCCCCCLSDMTSAIICTILMIILEIFDCIYVVYLGFLPMVCLHVLYTVPLICFLIGLARRSEKSIKIFKAYAVVVIINTVTLIYLAINCFYGISNANGKASTLKNSNSYQLQDITEEQLAKAIRFSYVYLFICQIIGYLINLHYYATTKNFLNNLVEEWKEENEVRDIESGLKNSDSDVKEIDINNINGNVK